MKGLSSYNGDVPSPLIQIQWYWQLWRKFITIYFCNLHKFFFSSFVYYQVRIRRCITGILLIRQKYKTTNKSRKESWTIERKKYFCIGEYVFAMWQNFHIFRRGLYWREDFLTWLYMILDEIHCGSLKVLKRTY